MTRFLIVYILLGMTAQYILLHSDISTPLHKPLSQFPVTVNGWEMMNQTVFSEDVLNLLRPTDYLYRQYATKDRRYVNFYLGYHSGGKGEGGIHSPKHCLPGSGWYEVSSQKTTVDAPGGKINLVRAVYQQGENRELFFYWFQVRGRSLADEYSLIAAGIINSIMNRRRDSAFVRISVPLNDNEKSAADLGIQFIHDFSPILSEFLPR